MTRAPDGTAAAPTGGHHFSPSTEGNGIRFTPGTLLAGRYRMIARLGRGGMGEVYRADDLKLGQSVALKFLPESLAGDQRWLRRFHDEVRIARDIAHPHVCRTYDIAEIDGEHFISMEYVDGEDLSALLKRIGRLPKDKAIQIARQLCAGLAAAHDKGVLHRDLKPANIMLDGRGQVRITDFGIAALADKVHARDIHAGTPLYMAPEQLDGLEVTVRSDIYSLGLVLYEVFTGREPFNADSMQDLRRLRESGTFTTPSSLVDDMDPLVERVIMRCLEPDPRNRPGSAIAVAAALPGGDPLAMALAAGETPSPEMVAHAGDSGTLRPGWAIAGLVAALFFAIASNLARDQTNIRRLLPMDKPPEVLADRVREIEKKLGYTTPHADWAVNFGVHWDAFRHFDERSTDPNRFDSLKSGRPPIILFTHRGSPKPMIPRGEGGVVQWDDPPFTETGMTSAVVDMQGRLLAFNARPLAYSEAPPPRDAAGTTSQPAVDWSVIFAAADLDMTTFTPASPVWIPSVPYDTHVAWTGASPEQPDLPIRLEAASLRGKLVWLDTFGPWSKPPAADGAATPAKFSERILNVLFPLLLIAIPAVAGVMAWRNMRAGRGDRRGAWRFSLYLTLVAFCQWLFSGHHIWSGQEYELLSRAVGGAVFTGVIGWVMYIAVEPFARRYWPHSIIAWTRLLSGRWRDPLVGRHVLIGAIAGALATFSNEIPTLIGQWVGNPAFAPAADSSDLPMSLRHAVASLFEAQTSPTLFLGLFVLLLALRIMLRRQWLAVTIVAALILFAQVMRPLERSEGVNWFGVASAVGTATVLVFALVRLGLLALVVMMITSLCLWQFPFTTDFSRWYAGLGLVGLLAFTAIAVFGFWVSLAGQPLFKDDLAMGGPAGRPLR